MARLVVDLDLGEQRPERCEQATQELLKELRALGLVRVDRGRASGGSGTKAGLGPVLGQLVLSGAFSTATIAAITKVVIAHVKRAQARSVTFGEGTNKVEFNGLSAQDQSRMAQAVAAKLEEQGPNSDSAAEQPR